MSAPATAVPYRGTEDLGLWRPFNRLLIAYLLMASSLIVAGYLWGSRGFDLVLVGMGWPHVILGLLFYVNKVLKGEGSHRVYFLVLLGLTTAICYVHALTPITTWIFIYFCFHAFRDEIFIYHQRKSNHRFGGPALNRGANFLLLTVAVLAGLGEFSFHRVLRSGEVSVENLEVGKTGTVPITFAPIENSRGRDYYFYVEVPGSEGVMALKTYGSAIDAHGAGQLLVADKPQNAEDLAFRANYENSDVASPTVVPEGGVELQLAGGQRIGQSFRAAADGLNQISLPIMLERPFPPNLKLMFHVQSVSLFTHPYAYYLSLFIAALGLVVLAIFQMPRKLFEKLPGLRFAAPVVLLFVLAALAARVSRYHELPSPLFFHALVVFHYFSWYVFYLEKLQHQPTLPSPQRSFNGYDRFLQIISTRRGFIVLVLVLNAFSFLGAFAYQSGALPSGWQYLFDFRFFLFVLVLHVTMSFAPKGRPQVRASD
jgi:hypothetical protein